MMPARKRSAALRRVAALVRKETWQVFRDPSSIIMGLVMPIMLLVLFGYGLSFDVKNVPVAIVLEEDSAPARDIAARFSLSPYFATRRVKTMADARRLMLTREVDGILRLPPDFGRRVAGGDAQVQFLVHGTDANTARIMLGYAQGALASWSATEAARGTVPAGPGIAVENRLWFNEANTSSWYLVPGLVVLVMTLIGAMLTALVVAREWERGTFEALFVTPVRPVEILFGKTVPYFVLGLLGLVLCVAGARLLFDVPLRGSFLVLGLVSSLYLIVALGIGLLLSSVTKSQFVSSQIALIVTFLPALMLSGFMFDPRSMPRPIELITYVFPARYFVTLLQTIFLAGDLWEVILPNAAVLLAMGIVLMTLAVRATAKRLG